MKILTSSLLSPLRFLGLVALASGMLATSASADLIAAWDLDNAPSSTNNPQPDPWDYNDNTVVSKMTMHGSIAGGSSGNGLQYVGWSPTFNTVNYVGFTVQATAGYALNLTSIYYLDTGLGGPAASGNGSYSWGYRVDGGAWTLKGVKTFDGNASFVTWTFDQPIVTSGVVEFAFFATAPSASEMMSPTLNGRGNDIVVNGTASAVPEPSTLALIGLGACAAMAAIRRRIA